MVKRTQFGTAPGTTVAWARARVAPLRSTREATRLYTVNQQHQIVSGVAAMSILFCAKTIDDAGAYCGGQTMRESVVCTLFVMDNSNPRGTTAWVNMRCAPDARRSFSI